MPDEAPLVDTGAGLAPQGDGWFVVNVADAPGVIVAGFAANAAFFTNGAGWTVIDAVKSFSLPSGRMM